jgi:hypothetical protein
MRPVLLDGLVNPNIVEAQSNPELFATSAARVMQNLLRDLPRWIAAFRQSARAEGEPVSERLG